MKIRCLALTLFLASAAMGQAEKLTDREYEERILKLEHAMEVLEEMGYETGLEAVQNAANRLREGRRRAHAEHRREDRPDEERSSAERVLDVLRMAHAAMREADKGDYAEMIERALAAHERAMEGVDHAKIRMPDIGVIIELLQLASNYYEKWGMPDRARATHELAEQLAARRRAGAEDAEIEWARDEIKALRLAEEAWAEADRRDSAELCRRSYRAMEMRLAGHDRDQIRRETAGAVELGQKIELLMGASRLYREWDMPDRAEVTGQMGRRLREIHQERRERNETRRERDEARREGDARTERDQERRERNETRRERDEARREGDARTERDQVRRERDETRRERDEARRERPDRDGRTAGEEHRDDRIRALERRLDELEDQLLEIRVAVRRLK